MNKQEELSKVLTSINNIKDVSGSALVTRDGLLITSELSSSVDSESFAAMTATIFGAAESALSDFKKGKVNHIIVESKQVKFITADAGSKAILIIIVSNNANLGLVLVEIKKAVNKIKEIIEV